MLYESVFYIIAIHKNFRGAKIEGIAQGVPIIAPDVKEYKDIVKDGVTKAEFLFEDDRPIQKLGSNGMRMAREKFH